MVLFEKIHLYTEKHQLICQTLSPKFCRGTKVRFENANTMLDIIYFVFATSNTFVNEICCDIRIICIILILTIRYFIAKMLPLQIKFYATAFILILSITLRIFAHTERLVKISTILPLSVKGESCKTDKSFITPLWTIYSTI